MSDQELMQAIKAGWGAVIAEVSKPSSIPESFIAALVANESGGKSDARRFEPKVLLALWEVLLGRKAAYGSIGRSDLVAFVAGLSAAPVTVPANLPADAFQRVDSLATSWGLTQIMGYHVLETLHIPGYYRSVDALKEPASNLTAALNLLASFAHRFQLDITKEFEQLFRCWNTGQPDGKTFDPKYVVNGLTRMAIWTSLE